MPDRTRPDPDRAAYRLILVALDGSPFAERVLPHVRTLAKRLRASIVLLRATDTPGTLIAPPPAGISPGVDGWLPVDLTPTLEAERQEGLSYLARIADTLRADGFPVTHEQVDGPPAEAICERARALGVDLIAMTTHGRGGLGRLLLGSVADSVVKGAPCAVLLVRAKDSSV
jgi:nucleotide-binding universal stress UspA family protein